MSRNQAKGEPAPDNLGKRLDPAAERALEEALRALRSALITEAKALSGTDAPTKEDLHRAWQKLGLGGFSDKSSLDFADTQAIVSQALRENRLLEWISYGMAVVLFLFGLVLLGLGVASGDVATRVGAFFGGSIVEILIVIPFRVVVNSRRENIALRMLGIILNRVHDPKKVAPLLKDTFLAVVFGKAHFDRAE